MSLQSPSETEDNLELQGRRGRTEEVILYGRRKDDKWQMISFPGRKPGRITERITD